MAAINNYEQRYITKSTKDSMNFYFDESSHSKTLENYIFEYDRIVLLGNPGVGKSTELENLFEVLWDKINVNGLVPFSINLKNFRTINNFEDLLIYEGWQNLDQIIFILDGLDEISEIEDFLSAFEIFINKYKLNNYKYVISCRTNIYEKYLVNISNFETFYLEDLNLDQASSILKNKYSIELSGLNLYESHYQYLRTPFFLNLFAEYYLSERKLPDSDAKMWEAYVKTHMENHKSHIKKRRVLNIPKEIKELKKVAFLNELRQKNFITNYELEEAIDDSYVELIENPFLEPLAKEIDKFSFEHRQLQEYFVAKTLSEKKYEEIISIIKIANIEKVHPTMFNAVSFLINLMDVNEARNRLIEWIEQHQIELLIKADSDRIDKELRIRVFKKYFDEICINKTYWITTNRSLSVRDITKFGDCEENYRYLIDIIENKLLLFRTTISAIDLISFFRIPNQQFFKDFLFEILNDADRTKDVKAAVLRCVKIKKFCVNDKKYLQSILHLFSNEKSKIINVELLNILNDFENIDEYFDFIFQEFLRESDLASRDDDDEVIRGNSHILNELILKITNSDNFIEIARYILKDNIGYNRYSGDNNDMIAKCVFFDEKFPDFMPKLFKRMDKKEHLFYLDDLLGILLSKIKTESVNKIFEYILDNYTQRLTTYSLATLANEENISYLIDKYYGEGNIQDDEIEYFRNILGNRADRKVAKLFNDRMIERGFKFQSPLYTDEAIERMRDDFKKKPQINFDILFKIEELKEEIKVVFDEYGSQINNDLFYKIHNEWYEKKGHANKIDTSLEILRKLIYHYKNPIELDDVISEITKDDFLIEEIKNDLADSTIVVSKEQSQYIENWVNKTIELVDFNLVVKSYHANSFSLLPDYNKWDYIISFSRKLNLELPLDFLVKSLPVPEVRNHNSEEKLFDFLRERINDKNTFDPAVIENLKSSVLSTFGLDDHIRYALDNQLEPAYEFIRKHFLDENVQYNLKDKLEVYFDLTNDVKLLKDCTNNINSHKCWDAISILIEKDIVKEKLFCIGKAIDYLEQQQDEMNMYFISSALGVFFQFNSIHAIEYYFKYLNIDLFDSVNTHYFSNYNAIEDYSTIQSFFNRIYLDEKFPSKFNNSATFLSQYISNLSKEDDSYEKIQNVLIKIKDILKAENNSLGIFHINLLIDNSENSYYNTKSKPLEFKEALSKVNEIVS